MNESGFDMAEGIKTNRARDETSSRDADVDTCRICRSEGSTGLSIGASNTEPLFHPCRCSGSIKHVHQSCLMEWLSHSKKKHCELCKTPFRFTKLYDAQMPPSVPATVLLRRAVSHLLRALVKWARAHLVAFVWLIWIPWTMRGVWRGLFWIADGQWALLPFHFRAQPPHENYSSSSATSPSGVIQTSQLILRGMGSIDILQQTWHIVRSIVTFGHKEPRLRSLARKFYNSLSASSYPINSTDNLSNITLSDTISANMSDHNAKTFPLPTSLLADVHVLRHATRSSTLNQIIIDTLEGLLITISLVVAFTVVFLIREWVMQQRQDVPPAGAEDGSSITDAQDEEADDRIAELHLYDPQRFGARAEEYSVDKDEAQDEWLDYDVKYENQRTDTVLHGKAVKNRVPAAAVHESFSQTAFPETGDEPKDFVATPEMQESEIHEEMLKEIRGKGKSKETIDWDEACQNFDGPTESVGGTSSSNLNDRPCEPREECSMTRPTMPDRNLVAQVVGIRRAIEESSKYLGRSGPPIEIPDPAALIYYWQRAGKNALEAIRLIYDDCRDEELDWLIVYLRRLHERANARPGDPPFLEGQGHIKALVRQAWGSRGDETAIRSSSDESTELETSDNLGIKEDEPSRETIAAHRALVNEFIHRRAHRQTPQTYTQSIELGASENRDAPYTIPSSPASSPFVSHGGFDNPLYEHDPSDSAGHDFTEIGPSSSSARGQTMIPDAGPKRWVDRIMDYMWAEESMPATTFDLSHNARLERILPDREDQQQDYMDHYDPEVIDATMEEPAAHAVPDADPEVLAAAAQAGIDADGMDMINENEDLEGLLELIGMHGPMIGLVQNAMFSALLIAFTILGALCVPYLFGKMILVVVDHPIETVQRPIRFATTGAEVLVDLLLAITGCAYVYIDAIMNLMLYPLHRLVPTSKPFTDTSALAMVANEYASRALTRIAQTSLQHQGMMSKIFNIPGFSATAHSSLHHLEGLLLVLWQTTYRWFCNSSISQFPVMKCRETVPSLSKSLAAIILPLMGTSDSRSAFISGIADRFGSLVTLRNHADFEIENEASPFWTSRERLATISIGYCFFAILGLFYLRIAAAIQGTNHRGRVESGLAELLYQAGGIIKVIVIISIEMISFPLFCGLLLDAALLPLFSGASLASRLTFLETSPCTFLFIHWFIGTCYMFHFALFVSMCRKILRTGVLFFIRDPDDPTFHPVRDVLERSISSQLWKILISGIVYGTLVIVCLGGVVWTAQRAFPAVFPIQWSSEVPALEFCIDLLFYNFLMPLVFRLIKPAKQITSAYRWWFHCSARWLRLSEFLHGVRYLDEQGRFAGGSWISWLARVKSSFAAFEEESLESPERYTARAGWRPSGEIVYAPSSDQTRIPPGEPTFLTIHNLDPAIAKKMPASEYTSKKYSRRGRKVGIVYIPPQFRLRIALFIVLAWVFGAIAGLAVTLGPLVLGRTVLNSFLSESHIINDFYSFSLGVYLLSGIAYLIIHRQSILASCCKVIAYRVQVANVWHKTKGTLGRAIRLLYFYTAFTFVIPALTSLVVECYFVIPLHTYISQWGMSIPIYFGDDSTTADILRPMGRKPAVLLLQDWTLGILYMKLFYRLILASGPSRPADALRRLLRQGFWRPDVRLATRGFILPGFLLLASILTIPLGFGWVASRFCFTDTAPELVYRYSYPFVLQICLSTYWTCVAFRALQRWRAVVRDEVYLVGELLHNFGETTRSQNTTLEPATSVSTQSHEFSADPNIAQESGEEHDSSDIISNIPRHISSTDTEAGDENRQENERDKGKGKNKGKSKSKGKDKGKGKEAVDTRIVEGSSSTDVSSPSSMNTVEKMMSDAERSQLYSSLEEKVHAKRRPEEEETSNFLEAKGTFSQRRAYDDNGRQGQREEEESGIKPDWRDFFYDIGER